MYAVVATGGKQYRVAVDDEVVVEKLNAPVGETVALPTLLVADGDSVIVDPAELESAVVSAEVLEHFKGRKAVVFKFKKRKGYKRTKGHRQEQTRVRITDVSVAPPKKRAKKAAAKEDVAEADAPEDAVAPAVEVEAAAKPKKTAAKKPAKAKAVEAAEDAPVEGDEAAEEASDTPAE